MTQTRRGRKTHDLVRGVIVQLLADQLVGPLLGLILWLRHDSGDDEGHCGVRGVWFGFLALGR